MIGTEVTDWAAVDGAYYAGMGSETLWFVISLVLLVGALVYGAMHEKSSYDKIK